MKRCNQFLLGLAVFILLSYTVNAACIVDADNDGYGIGCGMVDGVDHGEDCNDNDPYVHPNAEEICGNGIDDNCNGQIDETPCQTCIDHDGDGYGNPGSLACPHPETDCNDNNASLNPGVQENTFDLCTDGIDNNCNGLIDKDDPACAAFYPSPATTENPGSQTSSAETTGCQISSPIWTDAAGSSITQAAPDSGITMITSGSNCKGEQVILSIYKQNTTEPTQSDLVATFGEYQDSAGNPLDNQAIYSTKAPTEEGQYTFTASSASETLTSGALTVAAASTAATSCEIQWDCSGIDYGACTNGMMTRAVCPGSEGTDKCCSDEADCLCKAIYPEGSTCDTYTYAKPDTQKTCAALSGLQKFNQVAGPKPERSPESRSSLPWMWIAGGAIALVIMGAAAYLMLGKAKKAVDLPAALLSYVKAAKDKKVPDQAIKDALTKSGWKQEQIDAALKKAK